MKNRFSRVFYGAYATDGGSAACVSNCVDAGVSLVRTGDVACSGRGVIVGATYAAGREAGRVEFVSSRYAFLSAVPAESDYVSNEGDDGCCGLLNRLMGCLSSFFAEPIH